jgi:hypothetical protein
MRHQRVLRDFAPVDITGMTSFADAPIEAMSAPMLNVFATATSITAK